MGFVPTQANQALMPHSPNRLREIVQEVLRRHIDSRRGFDGNLNAVAAEIAAEIALALPQHSDLFWLNDVVAALRGAGIRPLETREG